MSGENFKKRELTWGTLALKTTCHLHEFAAFICMQIAGVRRKTGHFGFREKGLKYLYFFVLFCLFLSEILKEKQF